MKTKKTILSLTLTAALIGAAFLAAPQAQAGHDEAYVVAGAVIGGVLGYIASNRDGHRGRVTVQAGIGHHRRRPVVVHRPVVPHRPVHRPTYSRRRWYHRKPVVTYCTKPCCKPARTHHRRPQHQGHGNGRPQQGGYSTDNHGGHQGNGSSRPPATRPSTGNRGKRQGRGRR